ncbi:cryptic nitrate reductase 2 subunit beta [Klebsiella pneumoniae]|uniref:Cryptic nitrate reductase 2 subunit beta n=1 Tax=Klebsiella pneumoniae TaxID=573 RepID=A0A2X3EEC0_KLEPN|nr:cryptic nitrate reductase 2 subunit beta [Klebsiella pneumoniae]
MLPAIDDYYEPFTYDYQHLHNAPEGKYLPTARPRSLISGERMDKINWGPNWEELLGGEFEKRARDRNFESHAKRDVRPVRKYLHDVSPAPVRALPQPELRGHLPERRHLQA